MAHNFRDLGLTGLAPTKYVVKGYGGHDSNPGTDDKPLATIPDSGIVQIGTGIYSTNQSIYNSALLADSPGTVVLENKTMTAFSGTGLRVFHGIKFKNCNINMAGATGKDRGIYNGELINCYDVYMGYGGAGVQYNAFEKLICNTGSFADSSANLSLNKCILINFEYYLHKAATDVYVDADSKLITSTGLALIQNCNINGIITFANNLFADNQARSYALQDKNVGSPQANGYVSGIEWLSEAKLTADGANFAVTGWDTAIASCMNRDPKFNNAALGDYSLQAGSPHIGAASDTSNIGGTEQATSIANTDDGIGNVSVDVGPGIDQTNPANLIIDTTGYTEGYVDYIWEEADQNVTLNDKFEPIANLAYDVDYAGGTVQNGNVPDSYPLTAEYPTELNTTANALNDTTLIIDGHTASVGEWVRVLGEDAEITAINGNEITVATAFRAIVNNGTNVQLASEAILAALKPNRLTYKIRTSVREQKPTLDAHWDNSIDPIYNMAGQFLTQEWFQQPFYVIHNNVVYGGGDAGMPEGLAINEFLARWIQVRVFLHNRYMA